MVHYTVETKLAKRGFLACVREGGRAEFRMTAEAESDGVERLVEASYFALAPGLAALGIGWYLALDRNARSAARDGGWCANPQMRSPDGTPWNPGCHAGLIPGFRFTPSGLADSTRSSDSLATRPGLLDRRTRHRAMRAIHAAVPGRRAQPGGTRRACFQHDAGVGRHRCLPLVPTFRARERALEHDSAFFLWRRHHAGPVPATTCGNLSARKSTSARTPGSNPLRLG